MTDIKHKPIRSFVLRQGRLTQAQQHALEHYWAFYGIDFSDQLLDLKKIFNRDAPVTLEIGFGNGDSLLQQAEQNPERDFIGIEVHRPGVGRLLYMAHQQQIKNLRVINHDAIEVLEKQIPANSLDCVQLFFPDPWHKKRHHKRRIVKPEFSQRIRERLQIDGRFHLATDWENYAENMMDVMEHSPGFINTESKNCYLPENKLRPGTKFERRGKKLGHGVWDLMFKKIS